MKKSKFLIIFCIFLLFITTIPITESASIHRNIENNKNILSNDQPIIEGRMKFNFRKCEKINDRELERQGITEYKLQYKIGFSPGTIIPPSSKVKKTGLIFYRFTIAFTFENSQGTDIIKYTDIISIPTLKTSKICTKKITLDASEVKNYDKRPLLGEKAKMRIEVLLHPPSLRLPYEIIKNDDCKVSEYESIVNCKSNICPSLKIVNLINILAEKTDFLDEFESFKFLFLKGGDKK